MVFTVDIIGMVQFSGHSKDRERIVAGPGVTHTVGPGVPRTVGLGVPHTVGLGTGARIVAEGTLVPVMCTEKEVLKYF